MDWEKLRVFYHVAQCGSFTEAAERLNVSQSALSRSVITLEERLDVKLFKRHKRGISLTREGEIFYKAAQRMFQEAESARQQVQENEAEPSGSFKIATSSSLVTHWLSAHIFNFVTKYPKIRMMIDSSDELADIQIRPFIPASPDLIQKLLIKFEMRLYASKEYIKKYGTIEKPDDLESHQLLEMVSDDVFSCRNTDERRTNFQPLPFMQVNSYEILVQYIQKGLGVGYLDAKSADVKDLIQILPNMKTVNLNLYYIYSKQLINSRRITTFWEFILEAEGNKIS